MYENSAISWKEALFCQIKTALLPGIYIYRRAIPLQTDGNGISVFVRLSEVGSFHEAINEAKRRLLAESLRQSGGSIKEAAELLKVSRDSFVHHMKTLGVRK